MQNCCTTSNAFGFPNHSLEAEQKPCTTVGFVAGETVEKTEISRMVASFTSPCGGRQGENVNFSSPASNVTQKENHKCTFLLFLQSPHICTFAIVIRFSTVVSFCRHGLCLVFFTPGVG